MTTVTEGIDGVIVRAPFEPVPLSPEPPPGLNMIPVPPSPARLLLLEDPHAASVAPAMDARSKQETAMAEDNFTWNRVVDLPRPGNMGVVGTLGAVVTRTAREDGS